MTSKLAKTFELFLAESDIGRNLCNCFKSRSAESVDSQSWNGILATGPESGVTGQVSGVGRRLHDVADDGGVGKFGSDSGLSKGGDVGDGLKGDYYR